MSLIWDRTLGDFRDNLASRDPVPAGVSVAAVSACLGLSLLRKTLEIARRRKDFSGDAGWVAELLHRACVESEDLTRLAEEDIAAYGEYMARRKSEEESAALRRAIEVPIAAGQAALEGLHLCAIARPFVPQSILPDYQTAAFLISAAVRAIASSIQANTQHLTDQEFAEEVRRELRSMLQIAQEISQRLLD